MSAAAAATTGSARLRSSALWARASVPTNPRRLCLLGLLHLTGIKRQATFVAGFGRDVQIYGATHCRNIKICAARIHPEPTHFLS